MKLACPACVQTAATVTDHLEELGSVGTGRHSHPIPTPMAGLVPGLLVAAAWLLPGMMALSLCYGGNEKIAAFAATRLSELGARAVIVER